MSENNRLSNFDPFFKEDFQLLKHLNRTAFILRQVFISYRDIETQITNLSDLQIEKITGFHRNSIRTAKKQLIDNGFIVESGYHSYFIHNHKIFSTDCTKNVQPNEKQLHKKYATSCTKNVHQLHKKCAPVAQKMSNSIYTDTDTDKTDRKAHSTNVLKAKDLTSEQLKDFRSTDYKDRYFIEVALRGMGMIENEVGKAIERIYPKETGYKG